jgi:hypothetical protein
VTPTELRKVLELTATQKAELLKGGIPCQAMKSADPDAPVGCQQLATFFDDEGDAWCSMKCKTAGMLLGNVGMITQSELNRLVKQIDALRKALAPFAHFAEALPPIIQGQPRITDVGPMFTVQRGVDQDYVITCAELRTARALLEALAMEDYERLIKTTEQKLLGSHQEQLAALTEEVDRLKETEMAKMKADWEAEAALKKTEAMAEVTQRAAYIAQGMTEVWPGTFVKKGETGS